MRGSRSLLFAVRPQTSNIGNDLIGLGLDGLLEATWREPADIVELPAAGPSGHSKPFGLSARSMHEANQLADAVVVGGGNLLENGGLHLEPGALAALRAPLAPIGISHGRVWRRDGQLHPRTDSMRADDVLALCAAADPLLVRDVATAERLAALGVGHAVVAGCPALFLDRFVRDLPDADPDLA